MVTTVYELANYELASLKTRFFALMIDGLILFSIQGGGFVIGRELGFTASLLFGGLYTWFFLTRYHGQTPGKMVMKIRVIKADGTPIGDSDAIVRYIGYLINEICFIGWLWALIDDNKQGWHDKLASTYVVTTD